MKMAGIKPRRKRRKLKTTLSKIIVVVVTAAGYSVCAYGQQARNGLTQSTQAPPDIPIRARQSASELTAQNYDRVAATVPQIREVLLADPGVMVELKRWVAQETSDNGQLISDADLTDQAIFDRLTIDSRFRSVATRLVRQYGYLKPRLNPMSDEAKQQDLVLKERAKKIVEIEAQQDAAALEDWKETRKMERVVAQQVNTRRSQSMGRIIDGVVEFMTHGVDSAIPCRTLRTPSLVIPTGDSFPNVLTQYMI